MLETEKTWRTKNIIKKCKTIFRSLENVEIKNIFNPKIKKINLWWVCNKPSHGGLKVIVILVLKKNGLFWWGLEPPMACVCIRHCTDYFFNNINKKKVTIFLLDTWHLILLVPIITIYVDKNQNNSIYHLCLTRF
jgi:hypothetical protein